MKLPLVFVLILILPILESKFFHRITKVECGSSLKSSSNLNCYLKSYVRLYPLMNVEFELQREVVGGKFNFDHFRQDKSDQFSNRVLSFHDVEICKIIEEGSSNAFFSKLLDLARSLQGNFLDICHSKGKIYGSNISFVNTSVARMFPTGKHKTSIKFFDSIDDNIFNMSFYTTVLHTD